MSPSFGARSALQRETGRSDGWAGCSIRIPLDLPVRRTDASVPGLFRPDRPRSVLLPSTALGALVRPVLCDSSRVERTHGRVRRGSKIRQEEEIDPGVPGRSFRVRGGVPDRSVHVRGIRPASDRLCASLRSHPCVHDGAVGDPAFPGFTSGLPSPNQCARDFAREGSTCGARSMNSGERVRKDLPPLVSSGALVPLRWMVRPRFSARREPTALLRGSSLR